MVPDSGGRGCFELFEFDRGISGQSRAPGRFNYRDFRCPLGWSNWLGVSWGISVVFGLLKWALFGQIHGKSMAKPAANPQPLHISGVRTLL